MHSLISTLFRRGRGVGVGRWVRAINTWRGSLLCFAAFAAVTCLPNLGGTRLISMEPMIVDGARSMLDSGNWLVPRVYGELHTFKPALAYWMSALAQRVSDEPSELLLRAPFALSGILLGLGLLLIVGRRLGPRAGLFTALATIGTPLFLEKVRIAEFDIPLAVGVGLATGAAAVSLVRRQERLPLWLLAYASLAVGFLAKGTPALMVYVPGLVLAALATGSLQRLVGWRHLVALLAFCSVIGVYMWWAYLLDGPAIFEHPTWEAGRRGLQWTPTTVLRTLQKPLLVLVAFLPWSASLLLLKRAKAGASNDHMSLIRAALGFFAGGLLAFTAVPTHEMRYYLPLGASIGIAAGVLTDLLVERPLPPRVIAALRGLFVLLAAAILVAVWVRQTPHSIPVIVAIGALAVVAFRQRRAHGVTAAALFVTTSLTIGVGQAWVVAVGRAQVRDFSPVAVHLQEHLPATETLWVVGPADPAGKHGSVFHYLQNPVRTMCGSWPPPAAAFLLLVDDQRSTLSPRARLTEVTEARHRGYSFRLFRAEAGPPPLARLDRSEAFSGESHEARFDTPLEANLPASAPGASGCALAHYRAMFDEATPVHQGELLRESPSAKRVGLR